MPPELWALAIQQLSHDDQRSCLGVSRMFHELAAKSLFSTVHLFLGIWETCRGPYSFDDELEYSKLYRMRSTRSCEILLHIIASPHFAAFVKTLYIHANAEEGGIPYARVCLEKAICSLRNLRSLIWYDNMPAPTEDTVLCLAASITNLRSIALYNAPISNAICRAMSQISGLKRICLLNQSIFGGQISETPELSQLDFSAVLEANRDSLESLAIPAALVHQTPVHFLRDLTELQLCALDDIRDIDMLFRHSERLESLTLDSQISANFAVMSQYTQRLPHLTSLKIASDAPHMNEADIDALASFVASKVKLRRLDIAVPFMYWSQLERFLSTMSSLKSLDVLGIESIQFVCDIHELQKIAQYIPMTLIGLRMNVSTEINSNLAQAECDAWTQIFKQPTKLRFLHVHDEQTSYIPGIYDLIIEIPTLEIIGSRDEAFYSIERDDNGVAVIIPWSMTKSFSRTKEDFGDEDWAWIMRLHDKFG
ncbi:hypothetical protein WOLCODRAFT_162004 [Wolfiporia cocos MD-104 SS10]|uniref:F-box domain-containing protein n=1 Tax=Wolfiporia cocos (strain MD-104) TaxID=742152 RepID=A0A2H3JTF2_WOLCO|nr:hypothetical protein WOLCODRAFT_162004 [Wolfiporia cocos MD-104 SS10]